MSVMAYQDSDAKDARAFVNFEIREKQPIVDKILKVLGRTSFKVIVEVKYLDQILTFKSKLVLVLILWVFFLLLCVYLYYFLCQI